VNALVTWATNHQVIATFLVTTVASGFLGALPAPTKDSSPEYVFTFKFVNAVIGNVMRAISTKVENSPNFQDAVKIQNAEVGCDTPTNAAKGPS
jgi:hypothetical protein